MALEQGIAQLVQGFIAAGHVCTIMGYEEYFAVAEKYKSPIVIGGFEPVDLMEAVYKLIVMLEEGRHDVENAYSRIVSRQGNLPAQKVMQQVYEVIDRPWRGIGIIPKSGLKLKAEFAQFDADVVFGLTGFEVDEPKECMSGEVLKGVMKRLQNLGFSLELTEEAKNFIAEKGYDVQFGARPLHRALQKYLEDPLAEEILNMTIKEGDILIADLDTAANKITFHLKENSSPKKEKSEA